ncbi:MAG TPA: sigma-70 family RNA polymerase sigma factor [Myxococcota bacterium]|nr:sigma-70 family RNA polymerase sigma factor [Myxococcota bacterium]
MSHEIAERGPLVRAGAVRVPVLEDPDRELVARWRGGDLTAFEALVRRHENRVFRLLVRMLGSRSEAEDVAQETFLNLHRHGHRFRGDARFSTFVYRVAANAALNRRRSLGRSHARERSLATSEPGGIAAPLSPVDPEREAAGAQVRSRVQEALLSLSPALRLPLVLYDIEGLGYAEVARVLELAEGTVKSRIHRARQALRPLLGALAREVGSGRAA